MASLGESLDIIGVMLENDGVYPGDPQAFALSSYINSWGGRTFHVSYNCRDYQSLHSSPFCLHIQLLWDKNGRLTRDGQIVLDNYREEKRK